MLYATKADSPGVAPGLMNGTKMHSNLYDLISLNPYYVNLNFQRKKNAKKHSIKSVCCFVFYFLGTLIFGIYAF